MSGRAEELRARYLPFIGRRVRVTSPRYKALNEAGDGAVIVGDCLGIARRENGEHAGRVWDMVIHVGDGVLRTIALSRITGCGVIK